jgi:hypothetical protein
VKGYAMTAEPTAESMPAADAPDADAPARPLPACPLCGAQLVVLSERCPSCGGGLIPLLRIVEMADAYFNLAVAAAREKKWWLAAEHLAVTLALRADDVDALVLLGKVRWCQRQRDLGVAAWQEALRLAPDRANVKLALDWVAPSSRPRRQKSRRR